MPMLVTLLGMVMEVKPLQFLKAELPMYVTLLGMVMEVKPLQEEKAYWPMDVTEYVTSSFSTEAGITTSPE